MVSKPIRPRRCKLIKPGTRFQRLKVIQNLGMIGVGRGSRLVCRCICDCGNMTTVSAGNLRTGHVRSCGCLRREMTGQRGKANKKHGMSGHLLYQTWKNMVQRCTHTNRWDWKHYGGRGITVCQRWLKSFPNFVKDMGPKPSPELTLERFINYEGYKPSNCVWATRKEQTRNRRNPSIKHTA